MRERRLDKGFTLLEILIAMALFFVSITFLSSAYLNTLQSIHGVQVNQSLEQDLAIVRQQALLLSDPLEVEQGGEVATGQHGLARWEIEYEPTEVADLFLVTLSVSMDPADEEQEEKGPIELRQQFYLTRPSWSDPVERSELRARTRDRFLEKQAQLYR